MEGAPFFGSSRPLWSGFKGNTARQTHFGLPITGTIQADLSTVGCQDCSTRPDLASHRHASQKEVVETQGVQTMWL